MIFMCDRSLPGNARLPLICFLEIIEIRESLPDWELLGDGDVDEDGHLDQLPAHSVLHLEHIEQGVDQVLVNLVGTNIIIIITLLSSSILSRGRDLISPYCPVVES